MSYKNNFEIETPFFGGMNTALQFSLIPRSQSPSLQNAYMDEDGDISKRPGSIPVVTSALASPIKHLTPYKSSVTATPVLVAAAGTSLYKYNGTDTLTAQTMTNALVTSDIYTSDFTNSLLVSRLLIGDTGALKAYDGTAVANVTPAPDDATPAPANALADINAKGIKYLWTYLGHVFMSPGTNEMFYSKRYEFDYAPETQYFFLVRENDFINGCGIAYNNVCLIPMRSGWCMLSGENFDTFEADTYLNTINGVIAPRSITRITYPNGTQTIVYLSDDGMHEIYDTGAIDSGVRQYATRPLMKDQIDWQKYGFTDEEMSVAVADYIVQYNMFLLEITRDTTTYVFGYDTRNRNWYIWVGITINALVEFEGTVYFADGDGLLRKFDKTLYSDWDDMDSTTGTPVHFKRYSPSVSAEFSGFPSMWDSYLVESKQHSVQATLDITFIFSNNTDVMESVIRNEIFVEGVSEWGVAKYANVNFTDIVNEPNEIIFDYSRLSKYVQVLWENDRDEPVKIFKSKWKGRASGK